VLHPVGRRTAAGRCMAVRARTDVASRPIPIWNPHFGTLIEWRSSKSMRTAAKVSATSERRQTSSDCTTARSIAPRMWSSTLLSASTFAPLNPPTSPRAGKRKPMRSLARS
jgi:hypothetical protein